MSLIEANEEADMYKKVSLGTMKELQAKDEQIMKLESMKRDLHLEKSGMCKTCFYVGPEEGTWC